jgi:hypothetical protein
MALFGRHTFSIIAVRREVRGKPVQRGGGAQRVVPMNEAGEASGPQRNF